MDTTSVHPPSGGTTNRKAKSELTLEFLRAKYGDTRPDLTNKALDEAVREGIGMSVSRKTVAVAVEALWPNQRRDPGRK